MSASKSLSFGLYRLYRLYRFVSFALRDTGLILYRLYLYPLGEIHATQGHECTEGRFIRFGWPGFPDVLGQLCDGRFLAVEMKGPTGRLRPEQAVFLERINGAGGVGFMARDLRDVHRELNQLEKAGEKQND